MNRFVFIRAFVYAVGLAWLTLLALAYLAQAVLLREAPLLGPEWFPTARVILDCCALSAAGWVAGRLRRERALLSASIFAVTLSLRSFDPLLPLDVPWLLHLSFDTVRDSRYLESLATTAVAQAILFGCVFCGARLARPRTPIEGLDIRGGNSHSGDVS